MDEPRVDMRAALTDLPRFMATSEVSKHRFFIWLDSHILPDKRLIVIARSDDTTFGILHSRFHELWSLGLGTSLEDTTLLYVQPPPLKPSRSRRA